MTRHVVTIPGEMRGKERAGRNTLPGGKVRSYNPPKTANKEAFVRSCVHAQLGELEPIEGPIAIEITDYRLVPQSWSKPKIERAIQGSIRPTSRPDIDNVSKLVKDALNRVLWRDDAQIVDLQARKYYATRAYTLIVVEAV